MYSCIYPFICLVIQFFVYALSYSATHLFIHSSTDLESVTYSIQNSYRASQLFAFEDTEVNAASRSLPTKATSWYCSVSKSVYWETLLLCLIKRDYEKHWLMD